MSSLCTEGVGVLRRMSLVEPLLANTVSDHAYVPKRDSAPDGSLDGARPELHVGHESAAGAGAFRARSSISRPTQPRASRARLPSAASVR